MKNINKFLFLAFALVSSTSHASTITTPPAPIAEPKGWQKPLPENASSQAKDNRTGLWEKNNYTPPAPAQPAPAPAP